MSTLSDLQPPAQAAPLPSCDVCVRGSGIVAHALALALVPMGLRVVLQDAGTAPARGEDVRTFALNRHSVALLQSLGVWSQLPASARTAIHDMRVQGDTRRQTLNFSAWQQRESELGWIVDAAALEHVLAQVVEHRLKDAASGLERASQNAGPVAAALLAVAEGSASPSRHALGVPWLHQPYGQHAVAARLVADTAHQHTARQWFLAPDILALLPFDQPAPQRSYGLVWSVSSSRAKALMAMATVDFEMALNDAVGDAGSSVNGVGKLKLASTRSAWPLAVAHAERVVGPGWVLLGDAAHMVHPLAGQGLNLGLGDVQALVDVIAAKEAWRGVGELRLLSRYARKRVLPLEAMTLATDGLQQLFSHPSALAGELRNRGLGLVEQWAPLKRWLAREAI